MYDPEGTWQRRGIVTAAVLLVLVLGGGVAYLAGPFGGDDSTANGGDPSEPPSSSRCGLPDGDQTIPTTPPETDWIDVDGMATPISDTYGPAEDEDGVHSCFARNPTGALLAGTIFLADRENAAITSSQDLLESRAAPGNGLDYALSLPEGSAEPGPAGQVAGFRYLSYSPEKATYELVVQTTGTAKLLAIVTSVEWTQGDWFNVLTDDLRPEVSALASLGTVYTSWSTLTGAGPSDGEAPRPPPGWALGQRTVPGGGCFRNPVKCAEDGAAIVGAVPDVLLGTAQGAAGDVAGEVVDTAVGGVFEQIVQYANDGAEWSMKTIMTAWLMYPDPDVASAGSPANWLDAHLAGIVVFVLIGSVIVAAARLMITGKFEHVQELSATLVRVVLVSGLVGVVVTLGLECGDLFSDWILREAELDLGGDNLISLAFITNPFLVLILAFIVILTQFIQLGLMVIRGGVIAYLVGVLPLMAAASSTKSGEQGYQKAIAWLVAFVLYKPVAALIYAGAFTMVGSSNDIATQLSGIFVMILAVFALPAMMRLIVPATAALGNANAGAMAGATVGAALATGAVVATGGAAAAGGFGGGAMSAGGGATGAISGGGAAAGGGGPAGASAVSGGGSGAAGAEGSGGSPGGSPAGGGGGGGQGPSQLVDSGTPSAPAGAGSAGSGSGGGMDMSSAIQTGAGAAGRGADAASGAIDGEDPDATGDRR
ncbi:MAG: hypothetical protein WKF79_01570 [Nocardioides sp.]